MPSDSGDLESMVLWVSGEVYGVPKVGCAMELGGGLGWLWFAKWSWLDVLKLDCEGYILCILACKTARFCLISAA